MSTSATVSGRQATPRVSVCIPAYNKAKYIGETIESVLNQSYRAFDILVVDNCSADNTLEIIRSDYRNKVMVYRNDRNIGVVENFNKCISLAQNELLLILPADDTLLPRFLERTVEWMLKYPTAGFAATNRFHIDQRSRVLGKDESFHSFDSLLRPEYTVRRILERDGRGVTMPLYRKKCLQAVSGFRHDIFFGDVFAWFQIGALFDVIYLNEPLLTWRVADSGGMVATAQRDHSYLDHKLYTCGQMFKFLRQHQIGWVDERSCYEHLLRNNASKTCSIHYPPTRKRLLAYLRTYSKRRCLKVFSIRHWAQIFMLLVMPRRFVRMIREAAYRYIPNNRLSPRVDD